MGLQIKPCELKDANLFISALHRHHKPVVGHRFSLGCWNESGIIGVCCVGRPVARLTDQRRIVEVTRLCTDGTKNACSCLYSASARVACEMGYEKIQTFILASELGTSLKACGWEHESDSAGGDGWQSRKGRRTDQPTEPKQKWSRLLNV